MTPGLAFFYGGLVRRNHVLSIIIQNYVLDGSVRFRPTAFMCTAFRFAWALLR